MKIHTAIAPFTSLITSTSGIITALAGYSGASVVMGTSATITALAGYSGASVVMGASRVACWGF